MEIHLPYARAKGILSNQKAWVWAKFDRRPTAYLIFIRGWPVCLWSPDRQEGRTFRWIVPPNFTDTGATVCMANLLVSESVLQIEDLLIYQGRELWNRRTFSERWEELLRLWQTMPESQPLLSFKPRLVEPIAMDDWKTAYDASLSWIIQPDFVGQPRWFWWDSVTPREKREYRPPTTQRFPGIPTMAVAEARPYNSVLPDTYSLFSQEGQSLGIAAVSGLELSQSLRLAGKKFPVEVGWENDFNKFRILRIMPEDNPIATHNTFLQIQKQAEKEKAADKNNDTE
ncbi:MAG: hypothetical protein EB121_04895 [Alphaproteobacteria bacterium]|nr:hypothetical protein [Alphaproteobacteria bacterium]